MRTQRFAEAVSLAVGTFSEPANREFIHSITDFFEGDPLFAGLHSTEQTDAPYTRSYRRTAHACYPWHIERHRADQRATVVLTGAWDFTWHTIMHEVGHTLHWHLWNQGGRWLDMPRVWCHSGHYGGWLDYLDSSEERFAEAFVSWFGPQDSPHAQWWNTYQYVPEVWEFFDRLFSVGGKGW